MFILESWRLLLGIRIRNLTKVHQKAWIRIQWIWIRITGLEHNPSGLCLDRSSVANPDPGSVAFLTPGSGMGKKSGSGSGMNNPDHISESLETMFWIKILKFFDANPVSRMEKMRIRNKHPGSATLERSSVADPWNFGVDPDPDLDPRIHASD